MKKMKFSVFLVFIFLIARPAQAQPAEAAADAVNPVAFVTKLQVQPNFTWKEEKARQLNLTMRLIQPTTTVGLPFIKSKHPAKVYTIYRLEIPVIGQTFPKTPSLDGTGLSDLVLLDAIVVKQKWGMVGGGPALIIPTMKPAPISSRKWSAGFNSFAINTKTKGVLYGILIQQYFNFAGDNARPNQNFMLIGPVYNRIVAKGTFIQFSPICNWNQTAGTFNLPLSVNIGKAFARNLSAQLGPEYIVSGPSQGDFTFRFQLNAMFPPAKK
jgi:hypothetical protein